MQNLELLSRMIEVHNLDAQPFEVFLGKLQTYLNTQLQNKEVLVEMFKKSNQMDAMIQCPDCGTHTLLGFKDCNFCGCNLLEEIEHAPDDAKPVEKPVEEKKVVKKAPKQEDEAVEKPVEEKKVVKKAPKQEDEAISNTEVGDIDNVDETEDEIMKMRMPNLIRIITKYGLNNEIDYTDPKLTGRNVRKLRNKLCDALFGEIEEDETKDETKKEVSSKVVKNKKPIEKVDAELIEDKAPEAEQDDEDNFLPTQAEVMAMSRKELIELIREEDLPVNHKRFRKTETLAVAVDTAIEALDDDEPESANEEPKDDEPDNEDADSFSLDDLDNIDESDLDLDLELD